MSIYDISEVCVLMGDGCTAAEARRYLAQGAMIYTPEDYVSDHWGDESQEDRDEWFRHTFGVPSDSFADAVKAGRVRSSCDVGVGIIDVAGIRLPYVIAYCL